MERSQTLTYIIPFNSVSNSVDGAGTFTVHYALLQMRKLRLIPSGSSALGYKPLDPGRAGDSSALRAAQGKEAGGGALCLEPWALALHHAATGPREPEWTRVLGAVQRPVHGGEGRSLEAG